jgi:transcriptional regulator with XRE-family HTH domain
MNAAQFNRALHELGLSRSEAARLLGMHKSVISRYAIGEVAVPDHIVIAINNIWRLTKLGGEPMALVGPPKPRGRPPKAPK